MRKFSKLIAMLLIVLMIATMAVSCKRDSGEDIDDGISSGDNSAGTDGNEGGDSNDDNGASTGDGSTNTDGGNSSNGSGSSNKNPTNNTVKNEETNTVEGPNGAIVETNKDQVVDSEGVIQGAVTNEQGFIRDEEQGQEKSERRATEESKYDFDKNPLINRDRAENKQAMPSFKIDDTGFVADKTTIKDLKGKTLVFYTGDNFAAWSYRNEKGETVDEWKWFDGLKKELGLNIKKTVSGHTKATESALKDMNAGKQLDVLYSSHVTYPSSLCISRSITSLISINNIGSSPGVCKTTMDICKWGDSYRVIAPIGVVDVLWYNKTLVQELGKSDPHYLWEQDKWDWDAYSKFMHSLPEKHNGKELIAMVHWPANTSYVWPSTTGTSHIYIDANAKAPTLVNNWSADTTMRAWQFITGVANEINYKGGLEETPGNEPAHNGLYEGTTVMSGTMYTQVYRDTDYSKTVRIDWVPYPKEKARTFSQMQAAIDEKFKNSKVKPAASHDGIAQFCGFAMLLPKKTAKEANVGPALKFMELWATRFTEAYFDNLSVFEYHRFNYKERKQYFDFVTQNVVFGLAMGDFVGCDIKTETKFFACFSGDPAFNVQQEATKGANLVSSFVVESLKYGQ